MPVTTVVDVAIALVLIYLLLSLFCSAINEWIARLLALRAGALRYGINRLLMDAKETGLTEEFHKHPLVAALKPPHATALNTLLRRSDNNYPSYLTGETFATVLMSLTMTATQTATGERVTVARIPAISPNAANVKAFTDTVLQPLLHDVGDDAVAVRQRLETWFNESMEVVSGWYKRRTQVVLFFLGLVVAIALDVDTVRIARRIATEPAMREALVKQAVAMSSDSTIPLSTHQQRVQKELDKVAGAGLVLGWPPECSPLQSCGWSWSSALGFFLTTVALAMGAPFWFDTLNKLSNLRQTGVPPDERKPAG